MKSKFFSRAISLLLVVILAVSVMPIAIFATEAGIATISEDEQITTFQTVESTLAPGIIQTVNSGYAADGKLINYYIAIADINRDDVGVQASYKDAQCETLGMSKMTEQAAAMNEKYSNPDDAYYIPYYAVVAGVNGDGYNTGNAMPSGAHIMNGVSGFGISKAGNSSWFAIFEDGTALCGANNTDWDAAVAAHGPAQEAIGGFQLVRKNGVDCSYSDGSYLNDGRYPRSFVGVTADNKVVFMVADGNGSGGSAGTNWKESVEIMTEAGCTYILCLDGGGSATYISRPEGSNDIQVTSQPSDGSERAVSNGLVMYTCTPPSDVFEKAVISADNAYITPGSSVNVSAIGVSPAGTAAVIPENAVWTATNGTVENGVFVSDGTIGAAKIALTVDGVEVGSTTVNVVVPDAIAFSRDIITVPFGATVKLDVTAKYGLHTVVIKQSDVSFNVVDESAGTMSGWSFTAAESGEGTQIVVSVNGAADVTDTIEIKLGKGSEVLFGFEENDISSDLENWRISHHGGYAVSDISIVTSETGKVHSGNQALAYHYPMDEALHGTEFWAGNSLVWTGDSVEIENATSIGFWVYIPEDAVQFSIYMSVSKHDENGEFAGKTGSSMEIYNEDYINNRDNSGWFYFEMPISQSKVYIEDNADKIGNYYGGSQFKLKANCFIEFYAVNIDSWKYNETNFAGDFVFYIDDVTVNYSDAVDDREKPIFSDMTYAVEGMSDAAALKGQTVTEKVVNFAGLVTEDLTNLNNASGLNAGSAVAWIDGVPVKCEYADGMITVDAELTDGVHVIRMGISDNMGNYSEIKRYIKVKSGNNDASVRVQPQDSDLIYMLNGSVYWIDIEVDAIETVMSVEMKLDLDSMNDWELAQIQTLYGFDCEYSFATAAEKAENILTIKFTRNDKYLSETGTAVIASIPIRVWDYICSDDHEHADAVAAWNCNYVCAPALSVDVDTEMGVVTYLDDTSHTFSSEEIHTLCVSYTYGLRIRDYDNEFYKSHIYHVHSAEAIDDLAATCTKNGYAGRTWCATCNSPVTWGTTVEATGHSFAVVDGVLKCACGQTYTGTWTDGSNYVDGVALEGWINDSYWQNGVKLTGIHVIDGYYYDFGEDGICTDQTKFTGLFYDETVSAYRYAKLGELQGGWVQIGDYWHYFEKTTKLAVTGDYYYSSRGITYHFDETGKTEGVWQKTNQGTRFWYGEWYYTARNNYQRYFVEISGKTYNFDINGYVTTGIHALYDDWASNMRGEMNVWEFDENGVVIGQITEKGLIDNKRGGMYLVEEDGYVHGGNAGLTEYMGDIYFVHHSGKLALNSNVTITGDNNNGLLAVGIYYFGADGKLFTGVMKNADGLLCYYENGKLGTRIYNSELAEINGEIYLVKWSGKVAVNEIREVKTDKSNGFGAGLYSFDETGKGEYIPGFTGVKAGSDGVLYYYENGKLGTRIYNSELVEIDGEIYLVKWSGKVATNETRVIDKTKTNGLLTAGTYEFGSDGKLFTGVKAGSDGILYYYKDGKLGTRIYNSELVEIDGAIYLVKWSGKVAANETRVIEKTKTNGLLAAGTYEFGSDGKLFTGVKAGSDGILYYYKDGKLGTRIYNSELVEIDGAIYLVKWSGKVAANETRVIEKTKTNGLLAAGTYHFDENGKLQK
ncbi:MAG: hypothetical protein E7612_00100 [Ruminococcaceae bacterium]|nr:hypothetical protein [Oscillospiraceae bacterium]